MEKKTGKLRAWSTNVMEGCILCAVMLVPVFFNPHSKLMYEPGKAIILHLLAGLLLCAWVVHRLTDDQKEKSFVTVSQAVKWLSEPIPVAVVIFLFIYTLATFFSIDPNVSLLGSYYRRDGFFTLISCLIMFAAIAGPLESLSGIEKFITAMIVASIPVSTYGILQHFSIDPILYQNITRKSQSTLGNPTFLAGYMIMVQPFTLMRLYQWYLHLENPQKSKRNYIIAGGYGMIALLQTGAIVLSQSRGAMTGWVGGIFFLVLLISLKTRHRSLLWLFSGILSVLLGCLLIANIITTPVDAGRPVTGVKRFTHLFDAKEKTIQTRTITWKMVSELTFQERSISSEIHPDRFKWLRPFLGYGPDAAQLVFRGMYNPVLSRLEGYNRIIDRAHNMIWDRVIATGWIGAAGFLFLILIIFYQGIKSVNDVFLPPKQMVTYVGTGVVVCTGSFIAWRGPGYIGLGIMLGMIMGILVLLGRMIFYRPDQLYGCLATDNPISSGKGILIAAISAVAGHFIDIGFGVSFTANTLYFWVCAALIFALSRSKKHKTFTGPDLVCRKQPVVLELPSQASISSSILAALLPLTIGYLFLIGEGPTATEVFSSAFIKQGIHSQAIVICVPAMFLLTWIGGSVIFPIEEKTHHRTGTPLSIIKHTALLSFGITSIYWIFHSIARSHLNRMVNNRFFDVHTYMHIHEMHLLILGFIVCVSIAMFAYFSSTDPPIQFHGMKSWKPILLIPVFLAVFCGLAMFDIKNIQADMALKAAERLSGRGMWSAAFDASTQAISTGRYKSIYYQSLGNLHVDDINQTPDALERVTHFKAAANALEAAYRLDPLDPGIQANMGRLYRLWSDNAESSIDRQTLGKTAETWFLKAMQSQSSNIQLLIETAELQTLILKNPEKGLSFLMKAHAISPKNTNILSKIALFYVQIGEKSKNRDEKRANYLKAAKWITQAKGQHAGSIRKNRQLRLDLALAKIHLHLEDDVQACSYYGEAVKNINKSLNPPTKKPLKQSKSLYTMIQKQKRLNNTYHKLTTDFLAYAADRFLSKEYKRAGYLFKAVHDGARIMGDNRMALAALNNMGMCFFKQKKYAQAETTFNTIIDQHPTYQKSVINLAQVYMAKGDIESAKNVYKRYLQVDPDNPDIAKLLSTAD